MDTLSLPLSIWFIQFTELDATFLFTCSTFRSLHRDVINIEQSSDRQILELAHGGPRRKYLVLVLSVKEFQRLWSLRFYRFICRVSLREFLWMMRRLKYGQIHSSFIVLQWLLNSKTSIDEDVMLSLLVLSLSVHRSRCFCLLERAELLLLLSLCVFRHMCPRKREKKKKSIDLHLVKQKWERTKGDGSHTREE